MTVLIILASIFVTILAEVPAPYQASGWRPQGQQFNLPSRQIQQQYGAPLNQAPASKQYAAPNNQYGTPNNQYGTPNNQYPASHNQNVAPNNQYGAPVNQNPPNEQPARNFAESNFASNRINLNPNYESQNQQSSFGNQQQYNTPQNSYNNGNEQFDQNQFRQQNSQFGRLRQGSQNRQNQFESPRNDFGASNVDFQNARRPFNKQQTQNDERNLDQNLNDENDEQVRFDEGRQDEANKESEKKYGSPSTTTQRSIRGRKPERTTPTPITTSEETNTDLEQPNNVAISTAVAGSDNTGQYYILQPDGRLQRVVFMTSEDKTGDKNAAFIANIMYETVEPLKGPIYSYSADNQLVRIN